MTVMTRRSLDQHLLLVTAAVLVTTMRRSNRELGRDGHVLPSSPNEKVGAVAWTGTCQHAYELGRGPRS